MAKTEAVVAVLDRALNRTSSTVNAAAGGNSGAAVLVFFGCMFLWVFATGRLKGVIQVLRDGPGAGDPAKQAGAGTASAAGAVANAAGAAGAVANAAGIPAAAGAVANAAQQRVVLVPAPPHRPGPPGRALITPGTPTCLQTVAFVAVSLGWAPLDAGQIAVSLCKGP